MPSNVAKGNGLTNSEQEVLLKLPIYFHSRYTIAWDKEIFRKLLKGSLSAHNVKIFIL